MVGRCVREGEGTGWYHLQRDLYQRRLQMARDAPKGRYVKHTKYADEAAHQPTDRLAF